MLNYKLNAPVDRSEQVLGIEQIYDAMYIIFPWQRDHIRIAMSRLIGGLIEWNKESMMFDATSLAEMQSAVLMLNPKIMPKNYVTAEFTSEGGIKSVLETKLGKIFGVDELKFSQTGGNIDEEIKVVINENEINISFGKAD